MPSLYVQYNVDAVFTRRVFLPRFEARLRDCLFYLQAFLLKFWRILRIRDILWFSGALQSRAGFPDIYQMGSLLSLVVRELCLFWLM